MAFRSATFAAMGKQQTVYLGLGSNVGDRAAYLAKAQQVLTAQLGPLLHQSSIYETEAWGREELPPFLNQVIGLSTTHSPRKLLQVCLDTESLLGRQRREHWGNRRIDIDILFYGDQIISEPDLEIPHARLHQRNFVLVPLLEIAADWVHPVLQQDIKSLYQTVEDPLAVIRQT
ncbi:MAG: 2-amino-4-hydroxy-6-hydroxymethyldihydropteridine diphosphokinase [Bacteroidota bacterium]